jgi:predicted Zn-dependent protease with MMP-like domain
VGSDRDYETLDRAWRALDEGQPERALELTRRVDEALRETWLVRANASLDLDDLRGARAAVERAASLDEGDELDLLLVRAEVALREWRIDEARADLERALELERLPSALVRLALCRELDSDFRGADELFREAARRDGENFPEPPRLSESQFEGVLDEAVALLPEPFQRALDDVQVLVEPVPGRDLARDQNPEELAETPPDLLGLFTGASQLERYHDAAFELPPSIQLYQRNLERAALGRDELIEQIRVTLYHELAHMLGFDEEGVADLGLE